MLKKQGLYLPEFEHDNCGAGFICSLTGKRSNDIIHKALEILVKLEHRPSRLSQSGGAYIYKWQRAWLRS